MSVEFPPLAGVVLSRRSWNQARSSPLVSEADGGGRLAGDVRLDERRVLRQMVVSRQHVPVGRDEFVGVGGVAVVADAVEPQASRAVADVLAPGFDDDRIGDVVVEGFDVGQRRRGVGLGCRQVERRGQFERFCFVVHSPFPVPAAGTDGHSGLCEPRLRASDHPGRRVVDREDGEVLTRFEGSVEAVDEGVWRVRGRWIGQPVVGVLRHGPQRPAEFAAGGDGHPALPERPDDTEAGLTVGVEYECSPRVRVGIGHQLSGGRADGELLARRYTRKAGLSIPAPCGFRRSAGSCRWPTRPAGDAGQTASARTARSADRWKATDAAGSRSG